MNLYKNQSTSVVYIIQGSAGGGGWGTRVTIFKYPVDGGMGSDITTPPPPKKKRLSFAPDIILILVGRGGGGGGVTEEICRLD